MMPGATASPAEKAQDGAGALFVDAFADQRPAGAENPPLYRDESGSAKTGAA
jgi:hypothetical protein